jgi:hypothetical protein
LALIFVVESNGRAQQEMVRFRGYRELTYLLRRIKAWLNNHILVGFEQHDNKAGNEPMNSLVLMVIADRSQCSFLCLVLFDL